MKRNYAATDTTLINLRALKKRMTEAEKTIKRIGRLERQLERLRRAKKR